MISENSASSFVVRILIVCGLCSLSLVSTTVIADPIVVSVSDASGDPGERDVLVTISVGDLGEDPGLGEEWVMAVDLTLDYDAEIIEVVRVEPGAVLPPDWTCSYNNLIPGQVRIGLMTWLRTFLPPEGGELAYVYFDVKTTAASGAESPLALSEADFNEIPADEVENGTFTVKVIYRTLTVTAEHGSVVKNPDQNEYTHGTLVTLEAIPDLGYSFVEWSGNFSSGENPVILTMDTDYTIQAKFATVLLEVTPEEDFSFICREGGPCSPDNKTYQLRNTGEGSLNWTADKTQDWLTLSRTSGMLQGGESTTVTVSINSAANDLMTGHYSDIVTFTNETNHEGDTIRQIRLSVGQSSRENTIYVDDNPIGTGNDGTSWANAFRSLQDAQIAASRGYEIWVAQGTYKPDFGNGVTQGDSMATFSLKNGVTIKGGYPGLSDPGHLDPDARNIEAFESVLCGDLYGNDRPAIRPSDLWSSPSRSDNSYHVVTSVGNDETAILDGFTVVAGNARPGDLPAGIGGGLYISRGRPMVKNCTFRGNSAISSGGGLFVTEGSSPTLANCTFSRNCALNGAGIFNASASETNLTRCSFWGNETVEMASLGGGLCNVEGSVILANCVFGSNRALMGGAVCNSEGGVLELVGCTLTGNSADYGGGIFDEGTQVRLFNCIVWGNSALEGPEIASYKSTMDLQLTHCNVRGGADISSLLNVPFGTEGSGNIDLEPNLTPDGHLIALSPCIDAGNNNGLLLNSVDLNAQKLTAQDIDQEVRVADDVTMPDIGTGQPPIVDIGSDEFIDSDGDRLPDWWESKYFGSPTGADPDGDPDGDYIVNIEEYELYSSNPLALPIYVDRTSGFLRTIQEGIDLAQDGDTILVSPGIYVGPGNTNLDYAGKSVIVLAFNTATIDCRGSGTAINFETIRGTFGVLEGFTIKGGKADIGGGVRIEHSRFMFKDCTIGDNTANKAGGIYCFLSSPTMANLTIQTNEASDLYEPDSGLFELSNVNLQGPLTLETGRLDVISSWFYGPGRIDLNDGTSLKVTGETNSNPTVIRTDTYGPGTIQIDAGQQLIIEGDAVVNLSGSTDVLPDPKIDGHIIVNGSLVVQGNTTLESTNIDVKLFDVNTPNDIQFNNIMLQEASTGFGGEFYVAGNAKIKYNNIVSEGDRYLDMDPDPFAPEKPTISQNQVTVIIKEGIFGSQGTLLELRARDYTCGWLNSSNPDCASGAYQVPAESHGFTDDPSQNWVIEKLILKENAKLNLTNRQGFEFQDFTDPNIVGWETVYAKELVMGPDSVLNTALQNLYYQNLVLTDSDGLELIKNPVHEDIPLINGAQITDIPLLGFSLGIIAMNDQMEFEIRVRKRLLDSNDEQPAPPEPPDKIGSIARLEDDPAIPVGSGGVMDMRTQAVDKQSASSIAAKGAFSRAGDEDITIEFEYMFRDDPYNEAELIVNLSDHPEVGKELREVARIRPPSHGRPGSVGSSQFAVFIGKFPKGDLNFTRGTYVELELQGRESCCWIDNWDPKIECSMTCRDYNGNGDVDMSDYLLVLAESGLKKPANSNKGCLDLMTDGVVDMGDATAWDTYQRTGVLSICPKARNIDSQEQNRQGVNVYDTIALEPLLNNQGTVIPAPLLVLAKGGMDGGYVTSDSYLCGIDPLQKQVNSRKHDIIGRLITDKEQNVYCIDPIKGLVEFNNNGDQVIVAPGQRIEYGNRKITIGFFESGDAIISDAVFHPKDKNIIYMVPVRVIIDEDTSYKAAIKLDIDTNKDGQRGDISILRLYGDNPKDISSIDANEPLYIVREPDYQHLREVEMDAEGDYLFVLSACGANENNYIFTYEALSNDPQGLQANPEAETFPLNDPNTGVAELSAPSSMLISSKENRIYMVSSARDPIDKNDVNFINDLEVKVYCFSFTKTGQQTIDDLNYAKTILIDFNEPNLDKEDPLKGLCTDRFMCFITSIAEDVNGTLYVTGYSMPEFGEDIVFPDSDTLAQYGAGWFMTPVLATIPLNSTDERYKTEDISMWESGGSLSLPLSIVWTGKQTESNNKESYVLDKNISINVQSLNFLVEKWLNFIY
jgi:parallel beta-helix repeat protein